MAGRNGLPPLRPDNGSILDSSRAPNSRAGAEDGIRTRDPLLGNYPGILQAASEANRPRFGMLAANN